MTGPNKFKKKQIFIRLREHKNNDKFIQVQEFDIDLSAYIDEAKSIFKIEKFVITKGVLANTHFTLQMETKCIESQKPKQSTRSLFKWGQNKEQDNALVSLQEQLSMSLFSIYSCFVFVL